MSEWRHTKPKRRLHAAPLPDWTPNRDRFRPLYIYIALAATAAIVAVTAWVIWQEKPARSAADRAAVVSTAHPGTPVPQTRPVEMSPPLAESMPGDGTYLIGRQIKAGTYRSPGGQDCYWARLRDTSGLASSVIASNRRRGPQIVTIRSGEAFASEGCNGWVMIP